MKKILTGIVLSVVFLLAAVYWFIPGKIKMEEKIIIGAALPAVSRELATDSNWNKWWPGKNAFTFNEQGYKPRGNSFNVFAIDIYHGADTTKSRVELILLNNDSIMIIWNAEKLTSNDPFKRFSAYRNTGSTEKNMKTLLEHMKSFMEKRENIYGFPIRKTKVIDSVLISTRRSFDHKPGVEEIDMMIQSLKKYIAENKAVEKNHPMLNVTMIDSNYYEVMTAIAVDKSIPNTKEFSAKFLLKGGNILEGVLQGGPHTIEKALIEFERYRSDHQHTSPAIPYQLLVTDRTKETDTTKWITKLYYPIL